MPRDAGEIHSLSPTRNAVPNASPARISLVTLGCQDLAALTDFHLRLGWAQVQPVDAGVSFFRLAGAIVSLYPEVDLAGDAMVPHERVATEFRTRSALAINVASPEEADAALAKAAEAGGRVVKHAQKAFWGGYSGYFSRPEGNLWEVAHNPFWPLDERGLPVIPEAAG